MLGICVCAAAIPGERQSDDAESKRLFFSFFAHNVKSKQIGLSDEWTCLCPFGAGSPFVMPPLLRKQCHAHYCCQNYPLVHHHSDDDDDDKP